MNEQARVQPPDGELDHHWVLPTGDANSPDKSGTSVRFLRFHEVAEDNSHQVLEAWDEMQGAEVSAAWRDLFIISVAIIALLIPLILAWFVGPTEPSIVEVPVVIHEMSDLPFQQAMEELR